MTASPRSRQIFEIMILISLISWSHEAPDKLSPGQKAPDYARSSGGRALQPPAPGQTPANTGRLNAPGPQAGPKQNAIPEDDTSTRDESVSFKEVNGESVRVVTGNFGFDSPDGLAVSVQYTADENGNKASFTIGKGKGSGGKTGTKPSDKIQPPIGGATGTGQPGTRGGGGNKGPGGTGNAGNKGSGKSGNGGLPGNEDRKYLPPS